MGRAADGREMGRTGMRKSLGIMTAALLLAATPATAQDSAESLDGLVEINSRRMDAAFLLPGADFRPYTKIMLDKPEVAFRRDWLRSMNSTRSVNRRVTDQDVQRIMEAARSNFTDVFAEAFTGAGYQVVTEPGPEVMRVSTAIVNLFINAPDTMTAGRSRTFTATAGEATLVMEVRDSETNALMARVLDRRETRNMPGVANSVTNLADFRQLLRNWSRATTRGLEALKAHSPIPDPLTPRQRLE
jgi:hypothetical protein